LQKVKQPIPGRTEGVGREALGRRQYWRTYAKLYKNIKSHFFFWKSAQSKAAYTRSHRRCRPRGTWTPPILACFWRALQKKIKSQFFFFERLLKVNQPIPGRIESAGREALGRRQYWRAHKELYKNIKTQHFW